MPVTDLNSVKIGYDILNTMESTKTTSDFWVQNSNLIVYFLLFIFFVLFAGFILLLIWKVLKELILVLKQ